MVHRGHAPASPAKFVLERDIESAAQDVREKVAGALRDLPPNILPPIIQKADPDADPVISLVVAGDRSLRETTEIADKQIKRVLETVDGVGEVSLTGARERQIRVFADADKLTAYGLTISDVQQRDPERERRDARAARIVRGRIGAGRAHAGPPRRRRASSARSSSRTSAARPIRVSDLGRVEDSFAEPRTWNMLEGKQAVTLDVRRQSGTNTVKIIDAVKKRLAEIEKTLPPGVTLRIIRDQSVFINASVASLEEHLLFGSLLASLVVLLFIRNLRSVLIASLAIPTSIVATFTLLKAMDFTLNNMTLLALTLAVGIVIDDAIVVLENIVRYIEEKALRAARGRDRGDQGDHAGGGGDDALAGDHLPAHRLHERLRAALREPVRLDDGVLHPGLDAGELHAHPDAQLAPAQAPPAEGGTRARPRIEGVAVLRLDRPARTAACCAGRSTIGGWWSPSRFGDLRS